MYLADAFGYLGYVAVMLGHGALAAEGSFMDFFRTVSWVIAGSSLLLLALCWIYFALLPTPASPAEKEADDAP
jgi:hypothetical protein